MSGPRGCHGPIVLAPTLAARAFVIVALTRSKAFAGMPKSEFRVAVHGDEIVVTMPGSIPPRPLRRTRSATRGNCANAFQDAQGLRRAPVDANNLAG